MSPDPGNPTCNPPAPKPLDATILDSRPSGTALVLVVNKGARNGVDQRWSAALVTEAGKILKALAVLRVDEKSIEVRLSDATRLPRPDVRVRLTPP